MVQNPIFMQLESVLTLLINLIQKLLFFYVVVSPSKNEYANLTGFVTPKQIDMIIHNAKKKQRIGLRE